MKKENGCLENLVCRRHRERNTFWIIHIWKQIKKTINKEAKKPKLYENKLKTRTKKQTKKQKKNKTKKKHGRDFSLRSLKFHSEALILGYRLYCLTYRWCKKKCYNWWLCYKRELEVFCKLKIGHSSLLIFVSCIKRSINKKQ